MRTTLIDESNGGLTASEVTTAAARLYFAALHKNRAGLLRELITAGRHPQAGHDRHRWQYAQWEQYRSPVTSGRCGRWSVQALGSGQCWCGPWIVEAEQLPWVHGRYTVLVLGRDAFGQNDSPPGTTGRLPFCDRARREESRRVLIGGLGLGVVPHWLLTHASPDRVDVTETERDIIGLHRGQAWTADPRLHIYRADHLTWQPPPRGCALHDGCAPEQSWDAVFNDIWYPAATASSLPAIRAAEARYASRCGWQMSWEKAEVEARARRRDDGGDFEQVAGSLSDEALRFMAAAKLFGGKFDGIWRGELARRRNAETR